MDPKAEQVIPKVILKEAPVATGGTPIEQKVRGIYEELAKGNWRGALEAAKNSKPIDAGRISKKAEEIGTTRDSSGKKDRTTDPDEADRFKNFNEAARLNKDLLEKGYDALPQPDKDKLRVYVQGVIISNPALLSEFSSITPATEQQRRIELILKDPKCAASLREVMNRVLEQKITIEDSQIQDKVYEATDKENKRVEADRIVKEIEQQVKDVEKALKEFERDPAGSAIGSKARSLDAFRPTATLQREANTLKSDLRNKNNELEGLKAELDATKRGVRGATRAIPDINADILAKDLEIRTAESRIEANEKDLQEISKLQVEEASLKEKKIELGKNKSLKDVDLKKAELELSKTKRQLDDLRRVRADQENDLVNGMTNAVSEAANQYFIKELDLAEKAYNAINEKEKAEAIDPGEKLILDRLSSWLNMPDGKPNKAKIAERFNSLVGAGPNTGPVEVMYELLRDPTMPGSMTDLEARVKVKDPKFVEKMQSKVVERLVTKRLQSGKMTELEAQRIMENDWGKDMVNKALANKKDLKAQVDALRASGDLKGGVWEWYKAKSGGNVLGFLALVLGTGLTVGILPGLWSVADNLKK